MSALIILSVFVVIALAAPRYGVDSRGGVGRSNGPGGTALRARASVLADLAAVRSALTRGLHRGAAG